jgi:chromosome segregation ATPase
MLKLKNRRLKLSQNPFLPNRSPVRRSQVPNHTQMPMCKSLSRTWTKPHQNRLPLPLSKTAAVAKKAVTPQGREAMVAANIKREAADQEAELKEKIATQTAKKIELVHQKFEAKPISEKEKTITRDINNDGIEETISVTENKAIAKIEAQAVKDEQSGLKKIRKEAAQDEKVALKQLRAQIKKEEKLRAKGNGSVPEATSSHAKAGDIMANDQDIVIPDVSPVEHGKDRSAVAEEDQDMSSEEAAALAEIKDDLSQKEKDLQLKYAKKKAMRMEQAEKKARPRVQEAKVSLNEEEDLPVATQDAEVVTAASADTRIPAANPKSVQAQNVVLKKKFAQVVEMSQKDQDLIKNLETNVAQKEEKVDALESDLRETKTNLDSKVELIKQKEEKLKVLSDKIAAMESDVNSKQYDFKDKQLEYEKKLQAIQEEFGNYKAERANTEDELKEQLKILKLALEKKVAELNAAQEKLIFTESKLKTSEEKYAQTVKQYDEVKKTLSDLEDRLGALSEPAPVSDQAPLVTIDPQNLPAPKNQNEVAYQQWIKRQDLLVNKLKDKLLWAREQMEFLGRYDIKLSDQKMAALKEQLVAVKKQLNAQVPTGRTEEDFALMEGRLKDSQERLDMVEKILHEKDDQVKELEKQLNQVLSGF